MRWQTLLGIFLALIIFAGACLAGFMFFFIQEPDFSKLRKPFEIEILDSNGQKTRYTTGPGSANWTPLAHISNYMIFAVISSEDTSFYSHKGVDFHEIQEAMKKDIKEKRWARGASTITQQVIKNVYLTPEKSITRKVRELIWAQKIEKALNKNEILEVYFNIVEWGPGFYGVKSAANHYFGKSPIQLTLKESAFLAMLLPSPRKYHSYFAKKELTPYASSRVDQIIRVMKNMGFIADSEYEAGLRETMWERDGIPSEGPTGLDPNIMDMQEEPPVLPEEDPVPITD